ncbi:Type IV fimbrial assembly, ATPase PilB [hydrothermal vent metagenome]|uniref:Type IV fimbrial assembly, ATPase PilB n=1 Tax=hydrothermal vent metagenome TaxID=652676 RepID=A0A3B0X5B3_9ZZZZ
MPPDAKLSGLSRRLVLDALIDEKTALNAQTEARQAKLNLSQYLVNQKLIAADKLATVAANEFGIPLLDLDSLDRESVPTGLVNEDLIRKHQVIPVHRRGNRLYIAVSEPTNLVGIDEIKFQTGINTEAVLVEADKLSKFIETTLEAQDSGMSDMLDEDLDDVDFDDTEADNADNGAATPSEADDTPVVRFVNKVLLDAIKKGASDIHFEPYEKRYRVRLRIDGVLREVASPPNAMAGRLSARIKVMSRMDTAERRIPQDGRIKMRISKNKAIDFRVNTCPTLFGEKIVLRILDASAAKLGIDVLGYEPEQKQLYLDALANPYGMILVTGPTGSGKTVSLYTGLNILNTEDRNISTAEDPVEINLEGINQVNMNPKVGLDFNSTLRAFLRQDPDIIMVGEIRDLETAGIAIKAAQTGHMVMSTLHTNDGPQTLSRLINMGVPPFNIASAVNLIIAQRLARRLCENCKTEEKIPSKVLLEEGFTQDDVSAGIKLYKAVGCDQCDKGYKGRVGVYQVMKISEEMGRIIMHEGNALELADQAQKEGVADLRQSGLKKAASGVTSLEEINRVTKD